METQFSNMDKAKILGHKSLEIGYPRAYPYPYLSKTRTRTKGTGFNFLAPGPDKIQIYIIDNTIYI